MANLRTGDIKRFDNDLTVFASNDNWAIVDDHSVIGATTRAEARYYRDPGERIAKVIKRTPKYITVEITK